MTFDKHRWLTIVFVREDKLYYLRAVDIHTMTSHHVLIGSNGTVCKPTLPLDPAGTYVGKKDVPDHIVKAILAYLTEAQLDGRQLTLEF